MKARRPGPPGAWYQKSVLPGGLIVLTERMARLRSAAVGIWVKKGSRDESAADSGISHFIEHLVFKGTESRSCREIARTIDRTGGLTDASTSKEFATFSVKVMDEHLPVALDLLADILTHPAFDPGELENERKVIFEEIKSVQDDPGDYIGEIYYESYFANHSLGRSILGTEQSVGALERDRIISFFHDSYAPANIIVSAAGNVDHDALTAFFTGRFKSPGTMPGAAPIEPSPVPHPARVYLRKKDLEQTHINIGFPGLHRAHDDRYALFVLNDMLGGGMSSRLFQNIREKCGLAYSIHSYNTSFRDAGSLAVYTAVDHSESIRTIRLVMDEIAKLCRGEIESQELEDSKAHLKGSLMLGLESSSARMAALALNEMYFGRQFTPDEILDAITAVRLDDIVHLAQRLFVPSEISLVMLGSKSKINLEGLDLNVS